MRSKHGSQGSEFGGGPVGPAVTQLDQIKANVEQDRGSILTAPPFGFSPELPLRRPGGPTTRPAHSVPEGVRDSLRRLRGLHLRLSLCRVCLRQGSDGRLVAVDDAYLIAEPARDGSLIVVFIHPPGTDDDQSAEQILSQRLLTALQKQGLPIWALCFATSHCDAAAIDDGGVIMDALFDQPLRPLSRPRLAV